MTAPIIAFIIIFAASFRTMMYGIWTIRGKNIIGGVFVMILAAGTLTLAVRYVLKA